MKNRLFSTALATSLTALAALWGECGYAQSEQADKPLAAIEWLSDSLTRPESSGGAKSGDIADNALPEAVTVEPLAGGPNLDAVGLLPPASTGLPSNLWGPSSAPDLARRITTLADQQDLLPAARRLLNTIILAELDPPSSTEAAGRLFLARVDGLLEQGLLEEADALMERAGTTTPEVFRRSFDTKLLLGTENEACARLTTTPGLSPTMTARVFCLARSGRWNAAVVTLESGDALGLIEPDEADLLARFLDPELFADEEMVRIVDQPTPLIFRLLEAIGEPVPTSALPLAFAHSDLRKTNGWKARAQAAERLARVGALTPNQWLGIWTEHLPAASGGIWDRIEALQRFETAIDSNDPGAVAKALPPAWDAMKHAGLQIVFSELFAQKLASYPLRGEAADIALEVALLSSEYELLAADWSLPVSPDYEFALAIATGEPSTRRPAAGLPRAIAEGFRQKGIPVRLASLVNERRIGEAILRSIALLEAGSAGEYDELTDAIRFLRTVGLETTARRAALEIMFLERRG